MVRGREAVIGFGSTQARLGVIALRPAPCPSNLRPQVPHYQPLPRLAAPLRFSLRLSLPRLVPNAPSCARRAARRGLPHPPVSPTLRPKRKTLLVIFLPGSTPFLRATHMFSPMDMSPATHVPGVTNVSPVTHMSAVAHIFCNVLATGLVTHMPAVAHKSDMLLTCRTCCSRTWRVRGPTMDTTFPSVRPAGD
jgi:hypothetical protein